jgi:hypothetical protein
LRPLSHPDLRETTRVKVGLQLLQAELEKAMQEHAVPGLV